MIAMQTARRTTWPGLVGITGHHITQHGQSLSQWDLRIEFRNGGAVTVDAITLEQALAFVDCTHRMLIHDAPDQLGPELPGIAPSILQDLAGDAGIKLAAQPPEDEPPAEASDQPLNDPPSTGPEPAAAQEPKASGGWIPPGAVTATVRAGEYVLPLLPPGGACFGGEWVIPPGGPWSSLPGRQATFEVHFDQIEPRPHSWPQVVHVKPGETISLVCSCQTIAGGTLADDPNCQMHHGPSIVYVFDGR